MGNPLHSIRQKRVLICASFIVLFVAAVGQSQPPQNVSPAEGSSSAPSVSPPTPPGVANDSASPVGANTPVTGASSSRLGPGQQAIAGSIPTGSPGTPAYKLLRYDEDYSYLKDPSKQTDYWDSLKYIPLGTRDGYYLSTGVDIREWMESYHNGGFGLGPGNTQGNNSYFLQRYMLYADLHLGPDLRLFVQSISGFEDGRIGGPRQDIDRNQFDIHQGFLDWKWNLGENESVIWRLGRQEFEYGSGRLIDVREGPNLRLAFDSARVLTKFGDWSVDGWWAKPVRNNPATFDDDPNPEISFWGIYGVRPIGDGSKLNFDLYYLGFENKQASFDDRSGYELRHSLGTRIWGRPMPFEYNLEYVYQFGGFAGGQISAWTAANAVRFTLEETPLTPRPGIRFDVASGTRDAASPNSNTFNPLFPSGAYFNLTGPFGPSNIIDLHPTLDLTISDTLTFSADWNFFWRESLDDGVYQLSGSLLASGQMSRARYIGSSPAATLVWNPARHITVLASYVHVFPGSFLKEATPGSPEDYVTMWLTYRF